jgi:putative membrane protein
MSDLKPSNQEPWWSIATKGFCMGCADVVPGVSGGTVALVTGIYDRLVAAVSSVVAGILMMLRGQLKAGLNRMDLALLFPLMGGVFVAILSMAKLITYCMTEIPEVTWGLFLGLMLGSLVIVGKMVKGRSAHLYSLMICSAMISYIITITSPVETAETPMHFFAAGAIAIVAMILPGISGSFLLLIMGKYLQVMEAIKASAAAAKLFLASLIKSDQEQLSLAWQTLQDLGLGIVIPFALGCGLGLATFSWLLGYLLEHYRDMMMSILLGLMLGTLHKLWPIRNVLEYLHRPGKPDKILRDQASWPFFDNPMHLAAMGMIVVGFVLVLLVEKKSKATA